MEYKLSKYLIKEEAGQKDSLVISVPVLKAQVHYWDLALSVVCRWF